MEFRLHQPRYHAEKVLYRAAEHGHAVGFHLGNVDDDIRVQNRGNHRKGPAAFPVRGRDFPIGAIQIQGDVKLPGHFLIATAAVNEFQSGRGVGSSGAFSHQHVGSQLPQAQGYRRRHQGMGGDAGVRAGTYHQIGFNHRLHPRAHQSVQAQQLKLFCYRGLKLLPVVSGTGGKAYLFSHKRFTKRSIRRRASVICLIE